MRGTEEQGWGWGAVEEERERGGDFGLRQKESLAGRSSWSQRRRSAVWGPQQPFQETCSRLWPQKESFLRNPANCTNTNQHGNVNNNTQT